MNKKAKIQYLKLLADNLSSVDKCKKNVFLCPTCLREIKITDLNNISEAHIIPKAAKGMEKTFLCRKCNSNFGSKQDKWFGEIIKMHKSRKTFGELDLEGRHFIFGDRKFYGKWLTKDDGTLTFLFYKDKNSPSDLEFFNEYCKNKKITFSLEYPIMKEENSIKKGYLTAAYLYYFRIFGYSWVLQNHLNTVREQILDYDSDITKSYYFMQFEEVNWEPWIGLLYTDSNPILVMGMNNLLTILPTYTNKNLKEFFSKIDIADSQKKFQVFNYEKHKCPIPAQILTYYDKPLIFSDEIQGGLADNFMVQLITEDGIKNLYPISDDNFQKIKNDGKYTVNELVIKHTKP